MPKSAKADSKRQMSTSHIIACLNLDGGGTLRRTSSDGHKVQADEVLQMPRDVGLIYS